MSIYGGHAFIRVGLSAGFVAQLFQREGHQLRGVMHVQGGDVLRGGSVDELSSLLGADAGQRRVCRGSVPHRHPHPPGSTSRRRRSVSCLADLGTVHSNYTGWTTRSRGRAPGYGSDFWPRWLDGPQEFSLSCARRGESGTTDPNRVCQVPTGAFGTSTPIPGRHRGGHARLGASWRELNHRPV